MSSRSWLLTGILLFCVFGALAQTSTAPPNRVPVIVELFTSEGCSSCPPADALLVKLNQQDIPGVQVIALGQHVDYWNRLGWSDRFSSAKFSNRQNVYSNQFGLDSVYTPQMVVNGHVQFVGNDTSQARRAINAAAHQPLKAIVTLILGDPQKIGIEVSAAEGTPAVIIALTEDNLSTEVARGENGGRTLRHAAVVRDLRKIGEVKNGKFSSTQTIHLLPEWHIENLHAVVFLQNPDTMQILGAASIAMK